MEEIINKDGKENYQPPVYEISKNISKKKQNDKEESKEQEKLIEEKKNITINKKEEDELKSFRAMIEDNNYPMFEQIINPYYTTNYIPQPCFPLPPEEQDDEKEENENQNNYDENNPNSKNKTETGGIKMVEDIIMDRVQYPSQEEIKDSNNNEQNFSKPGNNSGNKENKDKNRYPDYPEEEFLNDNNRIVNDYEYNKPGFKDNKTPGIENTDQLNEEKKNEMNDNNNENNINDKDKNEDEKNKIKKSKRYNEDQFESIPVDDLNAQEDDEEYNDFE